ncbi:hypothetical protein ACFVT2_12185 [Streptomyces sp. NPDC058000]
MLSVVRRVVLVVRVWFVNASQLNGTGERPSLMETAAQRVLG